MRLGIYLWRGKFFLRAWPRRGNQEARRTSHCAKILGFLHLALLRSFPPPSTAKGHFLMTKRGKGMCLAGECGDGLESFTWVLLTRALKGGFHSPHVTDGKPRFRQTKCPAQVPHPWVADEARSHMHPTLWPRTLQPRSGLRAGNPRVYIRNTYHYGKDVPRCFSAQKAFLFIPCFTH